MEGRWEEVEKKGRKEGRKNKTTSNVVRKKSHFCVQEKCFSKKFG
jgi:hypothetical protein